MSKFPLTSFDLPDFLTSSLIEHVVLPRRPTRLLSSVNIYTKADEYDGGSLVEYLDRIGWSEIELVAWFSPKTSREIHAVLQTWTYFGLLGVVLIRAPGLHKVIHQN